LNGSITMKSSRNYSLRNSESVIYHEMEPFMKNYFLKINNSANGQKYFITSNPKYQPLHKNHQNNNSIFNSISFDDK